MVITTPFGRGYDGEGVRHPCDPHNSAEERGVIFKGIQPSFQIKDDQPHLSRLGGPAVVEAVKKTGRRKLYSPPAGREMCLAMAGNPGEGRGVDVYVVTDASAGVSWRPRYGHPSLVAAVAQPSLGWGCRRTLARLGAYPVPRRRRQGSLASGRRPGAALAWECISSLPARFSDCAIARHLRRSMITTQVRRYHQQTSFPGPNLSLQKANDHLKWGTCELSYFYVARSSHLTAS